MVVVGQIGWMVLHAGMFLDCTKINRTSPGAVRQAAAGYSNKLYMAENLLSSHRKPTAPYLTDLPPLFIRFPEKYLSKLRATSSGTVLARPC